MPKIEILAPVGSEEMLRAAVFSGADAVYLAGTAFGMRAFAGNGGHTRRSTLTPQACLSRKRSMPFGKSWNP